MPAISWGINLCVLACVCRLLLIPFLSWSPVSEFSGVWDLQREEGYKRARQETLVPGFRASRIPEIPRGPSPGPFSSRKPLCSLLASDPEALGSSRLLTLGQSFLARPLPSRELSSLPQGGDCSPNQGGGVAEEEGNQLSVRVGGQEGDPRFQASQAASLVVSKVHPSVTCQCRNTPSPG